jgi:hypothetical protein
LSNGQILTDLLSRGATSWRKTQANEDRLIEELYQRALCRRPNAAELATAREIVGTPITNDGVADLLWVVVMLPEFQLIR